MARRGTERRADGDPSRALAPVRHSSVQRRQRVLSREVVVREPTAQPRDERTERAYDEYRRLPTLDEQDWPDRPNWPGRDWKGRDL